MNPVKPLFAPRLPLGVRLIWDGALSTVQAVLPSEQPDGVTPNAAPMLDPVWRSGNQPNASTTLDGDTLECGIWDVAVNGQTGARAFATVDGRWELPEDRTGKTDRLEWLVEVPQHIPVEQGAGNFCTLGVEGKMSANGIWSINAEVVNGHLRHWLMNQSGATVYHSSAPADPIPVGLAYPCVLDVKWATDHSGIMDFYYLSTHIHAENVATLAPDGTLGLAWALYVGESAAVLKSNRRYAARFSQPRLWALPEAA